MTAGLIFYGFFWVVTFISCCGAICLLRPLSFRHGLVDIPNERKRHTGQIPLVGGVSIFISVVIGISLFFSHHSIFALTIISAFLIAAGLLDDFVELKISHRLVVQIAAVLLMVFWGGVQIEQVGNLFGNGTITLGFYSVFFTLLCTVGVINSINMIDGLDGLSSSMVLISMSALSAVAFVNADKIVFLHLSLHLSALIGFMVFNLSIFGKSYKVFLGDAGSTYLGFILAWYFISFSQSDNSYLSAVSAGWIFGLPLVDTVSVMVRRLRQSRSPFAADREHLHHLLLDASFSPRGTLIILVLVHMLFVLVGLLFNGKSSFEPYLFWSFVLLVVLHHYFTPKLLRNK